MYEDVTDYEVPAQQPTYETVEIEQPNYEDVETLRGDQPTYEAVTEDIYDDASHETHRGAARPSSTGSVSSVKAPVIPSRTSSQKKLPGEEAAPEAEAVHYRRNTLLKSIPDSAGLPGYG